MDETNDKLKVPIIQEEAHADAVPVVTGGVRVTKRVETDEEVLEQELRKSHVEVKRVKANRIVDGPQPSRRSGNTLIIPVVAEVLRVEKQWVVTEEIHITEHEERETVREAVPVNRETAHIERLDSAGNVIEAVEPDSPTRRARPATEILPPREESQVDDRKPLADPPSILAKRRGRVPE